AALDRRADETAVFGPAAVVVADPVVAEQVLEHEPGVRASLADAAVRDRLVGSIEALVGVDAPELVGRLESAVRADRRGPGNVDRARDVPAALCALLRKILRREELARELFRRSDVDELPAVLRDRLEDVRSERSHRTVGGARLVLGGRVRRDGGRDGPAF